MQKLLTIVVPVYKVEPYINKCLDSCLIYRTNGHGERVLNEELMNQLEVIIVNDGTPDRSAELSREYVKRYPNTFRQIDKENGGHGSAWNVGLKEATGKYLRFLDSDDWLTNLNEFMGKLAMTDADCVLTHINNYHEDTGRNDKWAIEFGDFDKPHTLDDFAFSQLSGKTNVFNFWFCTYKTELLKPLCPLFMEHVMYDDSILYAIPLLFAKNYICYDIVLYNYLTGRAGQSMNATVKRKNITALCKTYQYEMEFISQHINNAHPSRHSAIHQIMASDSTFLLNMLVLQPYGEYNKALRAYKSYFHMECDEWKQSKMAQRFTKHSPAIFYMIEKLRQLLHK